MEFKHKFCSVFMLILLVANSACNFPLSLEQAKAQVEEEAAQILAQDPCTATEEDVQDALETASEAQKIPGLEGTADQLLSWAKKGFQSYAAGRSAAGADAQERTNLAAAAQQLGLDEMAQDLMSGNPIASGCEKEWQGTLDSEVTTLVASVSISGDEEEATLVPLQMDIDFSFVVAGEQITGSGTGAMTGAVGGYTVTIPEEVTISGTKSSQGFVLEFVITAYWTYSPPSEFRLTVTVPAQYGGEADCSNAFQDPAIVSAACRVQISPKR